MLFVKIKIGCDVVNNNMPYNNGQWYSNTVMNIPIEYKPISAWGYFGYNILFSIPLIGFIFLLVYALGGTRNINLKNYARSFFCIYAIVGIILGILIASGVIFSTSL